IARRGALPASTVVLAVGLLAAAAALTGALVVSLGDLRGAFATSESQAQLLARVLEDQTTRTFEAGEMVLFSLSQTPLLQAGAADRDGTENAMRQVLTALTFARSVAVVDLEGQVLASTDPAASGIRIDTARLGPLPAARIQRIGPLFPGRGLESLSGDAAAASIPP
ncbi:cache domain-containing protein, partial [Raoultella sp. 18072]|uniref:cache domain-containing protein n=1 Tax=Raoultella sp. 18072 TaxID=2681451 RepID=UPI00190F4979